MSFKAAKPGDLIVAIGGRTGRDGIHGATFSSGVLTEESETVSSGAVQIGNAIAEKKVAEAVLRARDAGLFDAITDCGAGGFSSAVGEMGAEIGARVELAAAPLKYAGLSYTEIWISEAQERMVLAVPEEKYAAFADLCAEEGVESTILGEFEPTGRLKLVYDGAEVCDLDMRFLHDGRPNVERIGVWKNPPAAPFNPSAGIDHTAALHRLLSSWNIASKEWIVRQYDHEVQGGSVVKPFVGVGEGPGDAAVVRPLLDSHRGIAVGCGLQIGFGDLDPYCMATAAIDEAIRNVVAVGGDPRRTAILDNFSWGDVRDPAVFGSLVAAAQGCKDAALAFEAPFVSGKDSLNNEFTAGDTRIVIPPTLLVSALAIVPDVRRAVTMDLKEPGNLIVVVGATRAEMGGSQYNSALGGKGGAVPAVDGRAAAESYVRVHACMQLGLIRACHDCSEGGLAVALAEMAFAGELGVAVDLSLAPQSEGLSPTELLFAESCSRLILEIAPECLADVQQEFRGAVYATVGTTTADPFVTIRNGDEILVREFVAKLRESWRRPFAW
jgi:phosphoribosylformylglycinamidine synthase